MKEIAIIGTVGLPANYGGFETLTQYLTKHLSNQFKITVFCSTKSYRNKLKTYNGAELKYVNLHANGIQSILFDMISILWALFFADTLLILGVSGCIILPIVKLFSNKRLVVNIDGLEWKREKWGTLAKCFLKFSEKIAVMNANTVIADNKVIKDYVLQKYGVQSELIAYGANHCTNESLSNEVLLNFPFLNDNYAFKVCRIEPENKLDLILDVFSKTSNLNIAIVGNWNNSSYSKNLKKQYNGFKNIYLLDPIYNLTELNQLRCNCFVYIHGHSAGGTNPSLVEAMYLGLPIIAYGVPYNRETTHYKAMYFDNKADLQNIIASLDKNNLAKISQDMKDIAISNYTWELIANKYSYIL